MNAELISRCVRAMTETGEGSLVPLCRKIVEDERVKGHTNLARQLDLIVAKAESKPRTQAMRPLGGGRSPQTGRPTASVFITRLEQDQLRHEMVLDEAIENRFKRIEKEYLARERLANTQITGLYPSFLLILLI